MPFSKEERKLVEKIGRRDERALFLIYKKYQKSIFTFVNRQIKNKHLSEEITQDVFLDFIDALRDFRGESSLSTFIFSIAKYKVIDHIRKKKIRKILFSALPAYFIERIAKVVMDDEIEKRELSAKIKNILDHLPNDYSIILRLKYIDGEKVKAIAKKLSMSFKATESLLFRARKTFVKSFKNSP